MAKSKQYYLRKAHRYPDVLRSLQFLLWIINGLYFSWTNIDEIQCDLQHQHPPHLLTAANFISPAIIHGKQQPERYCEPDFIWKSHLLKNDTKFNLSYRL